MNIPTYAEVKSSKKKQLIEMCVEFALSHKSSNTVDQLQEIILSGLGIVKKSDTQLPLHQIEADVVSETPQALADARNVNDVSKKAARISVTIDELIEYWQRGYICHPAIIKAASKNSYYESSKLASLPEIDLYNAYDPNCEIHLSLQLSDKKVDKFGLSDIVPITCIKSIDVNDNDRSLMVMNVLRNTSRGYSSNDQEVRINPIQGSSVVVLEKELFVDHVTLSKFNKLNSLLGGISVSSYLEKIYLAKGKYYTTSMDRNGTFYSGLINNDRKEHDGKKLLNFIIEKVKGHLITCQPSSSSYFFDVIQAISSQDDKELERLIIGYHSKDDSKISPFELLKIQEALKEQFLREAINRIPKRPSRDPFFLFYCFLNQFSNTKNPAAADKQSFLFAIDELFEDNTIDDEEAIIISFLLGYYVGYSMVWNPSNKVHDGEWNGNLKFLELLYDPAEIQPLLERIASILNLNYYKNGLPLNDNSLKINSLKSSNRELIVGSKQIELKDACLQKFIGWKNTNKDVSLLNLALFYDNATFEEYVTGLLEARTERNLIIKRIEDGLRSGTFTMKERSLIGALIE